MKLQLKLLLTVAFTIVTLYVGRQNKIFSPINWKEFSQPKDIVSNTSSTDKPAVSEYSTFSPEIEYKVSVKSAVAENDNDPFIECHSDQKCGGGTVTVKESECTQLRCCEYSPGKWKNMSESGCFEAQNNSYDKLHIVPSLTPTSMPVPDPIRIAAIKTAIQQAELYKSKANLAWEQMFEYKKEQLNCGPRTRENAIQSAEKGVPLSPSSQHSIQQICEGGYQPLIDEFRLLYENASYQYNEYYRQANKLLSECSGCAQYLKISE